MPTRLLDWTVSPLIAAHFATAELQQAEADAVIWCVDAWGARRLMPRKMLATLDGRGAWTFDVDLLDASFPALEDFDAARGEVLMFFEPPSIDSRIQNQYAVFSAMNGPGKSQHAYLAKVSHKRPELVRRVVIAAAAKPKIRDMLDQNNINERMLFPGLPGLCDWLRRYYSPAGGPRAAAAGAATGRR
ncbi:MAG: FRG domain-containing protein [Acidobacteria bacterium]|nr:FRG domain-containing protein [Acidobacteriota bacterium]